MVWVDRSPNYWPNPPTYTNLLRYDIRAEVITPVKHLEGGVISKPAVDGDIIYFILNNSIYATDLDGRNERVVVSTTNRIVDFKVKDGLLLWNEANSYDQDPFTEYSLHVISPATESKDTLIARRNGFNFANYKVDGDYATWSLTGKLGEATLQGLFLHRISTGETKQLVSNNTSGYDLSGDYVVWSGSDPTQQIAKGIYLYQISTSERKTLVDGDDYDPFFTAGKIMWITVGSQNWDPTPQPYGLYRTYGFMAYDLQTGSRRLLSKPDGGPYWGSPTVLHELINQNQIVYVRCEGGKLCSDYIHSVNVEQRP